MDNNESDQDTIARIVAAFAARPDSSPDDIVDLYQRLSGAPASRPAPQARPRAADQPVRQPALPIENAVTEDKVYCLCCGRGFKMLKRHLGSEHGMTETDYRLAFGLPDDFPLVAPSYSAKKADHAKKAGFGKYDRATQGNEA
ncbi:MAG: MucR family transcriptional regulator [Pseudooceanicola sp.]